MVEGKAGWRGSSSTRAGKQPENVWPPYPPPDESELERAVRLEEEREAKLVSDAIDRALEAERQTLRRERKLETKLLLLGESGSSVRRGQTYAHRRTVTFHDGRPIRVRQIYDVEKLPDPLCTKRNSGRKRRLEGGYPSQPRPISELPAGHFDKTAVEQPSRRLKSYHILVLKSRISHTPAKQRLETVQTHSLTTPTGGEDPREVSVRS